MNVIAFTVIAKKNEKVSMQIERRNKFEHMVCVNGVYSAGREIKFILSVNGSGQKQLLSPLKQCNYTAALCSLNLYEICRFGIKSEWQLLNAPLANGI